VVAPRGELTVWPHCAVAATGQAQLSCALVVHSAARDVRPRRFLTSETSTPGETMSRRIAEKGMVRPGGPFACAIARALRCQTG
jgi:hypothetical protein